MSRKTMFAMMTFAGLGIVILTFYTSLDGLSRKLAYITFSNLTFRNMEILKYIYISNDNNNSSAQGQFTDNNIRLPLTNTTSVGLLDARQFTNVSGKGNISAIPATKAAEIHQDQTTASATSRAKKLAEVRPITTTMTFNKSLEVRCKESPFIDCASPPIITMKSEKIFKVSFLRQPFWQPVKSLYLKECRYKQCQFVDTNITRETDLVVVHGVGLRDNYRPPKRWSHQLYVISMWESPVHTGSDFITSEIAMNKTKTAFWMVSHCSTASMRERYVTEMQKYIDVDILGACGQPCSKKTANCEGLHSRYKFYLSFENSLCTDYVTEKFFKLFVPGNHVIPVVRGGADYDKYFPNFTFINAAHFPKAKDLALHLKNLAADLETYSKYLEYKDIYIRSIYGFDMACNICEYLHTRTSSQPKTYNLKSWAADGHCHSTTDL